MRVRQLGNLALVGLLVLTAGAATPGPRPDVYSNIHVDRDTDDQDGAEIRFTLKGGAPRVDFIYCEGGCHPWPTHDVRLQGQSLTFLADDELIANGHPYHDTYHFIGRFRGDELFLRSDDFGGGGWLQRMRRRPNR